MKRILDYTPDEQLEVLKDICNEIYIARNLSLNSLDIIRQPAYDKHIWKHHCV